VAATVTDSHTLSYQWYSNTSRSNTGGTAVSGATDATYTIPTSKAAGDYYYYCVVKDALACCSNGVEFVCGKGDDKNAKAYPKEKTDITVTGTYETYKEKGSDSLYCRLKDATIETGVKQ
jgi:hypothetical protein